MNDPMHTDDKTFKQLLQENMDLPQCVTEREKAECKKTLSRAEGRTAYSWWMMRI